MEEQKICSKLLILFAFSGFLVVSNACEQKVQKVNFKNLRCNNVSSKYIYPNYTCYAKSFNRTCSTLTVIGTAKTPLNNFKATGGLFYKYGTIYREVIHVPMTDICPLVELTSIDNPLLRQIIQVIKESAPHLIHKCPYQGFNGVNIGLKTSSMASLFPTGDYKVAGTAYESDEIIVTFQTHFSVQSPNRDTFG